MNLELIKEALENGANLQIDFHGVKGEQAARKLIERISSEIGSEIDKKEREGTKWVSSQSRRIEVTAFYEEDEHGTTGTVVGQIFDATV